MTRSTKALRVVRRARSGRVRRPRARAVARRRAPHDDPFRRRQGPGSLEIGVPLHDLDVEGAVDLEDQDRSIGKIPLAVRPSHLPAAVGPPSLSGGRPYPELTADTTYGDLGTGVGATGDVTDGGTEPSGTSQGMQCLDPGEQAIRRGQSLLDGCGERAVCRPQRRVV